MATLGGQPQVVTFALDALLARGERIEAIVILHFSLAQPRLSAARARLSSALAAPRYAGIEQVQWQALRDGQLVLDDVRHGAAADRAWRSVNQLIARLKRDGRTLHVCVSGGRRIVALLTMSAAMLHFGHHDALWHMYTPDDVQVEARDGAVMHLPPDSGFQLIRVPLLPWGAYFPALRQLTQPAANDEDVLAPPRRYLDALERGRCAAVEAALTERQNDVLRFLAAGLHPAEVADRLSVSRKTIDSHKTVILAECRNTWGVPVDRRLDYRFVAEKFGEYFV